MNLTQAKEILGERFGYIADDANKVIQGLKLPSNASILDVGTGMGYFAIMLALNGYSVLTGEPESDNSIYAKNDWLSNSRKVGVDHLIKFEAFDARDMPFDDNSFDAIFFFGVLHHINENHRINVFQESVRTTKPNAVICFFEPNKNVIKLIKENDPSHPDAADPNKYIQGFNLNSRNIEGSYFDAFVFQKRG